MLVTIERLQMSITCRTSHCQRKSNQSHLSVDGQRWIRSRDFLSFMYVNSENHFDYGQLIAWQTINQITVLYVASELNFYKKNMHLCGGVLVNERFVLTAAHCVFDLYDDQITSGRLNVGWGDSLTDIYDRGRVLVSRVHLHPDFNVTAEKSIGGSNQKSGVDLAMLELATPVSFNPLPGQTEPELGPACLHWNIWELFGSQYSTVGWGIERQMLTSQRKLMRFESPLSNRLQQVPLVELGRRHPACRARSDLQCFQPLWARQMLCVGDSGGPLHLKHRGIHKVIGILSFGVQIPKYECMPNAVFSSISASKDWIQNLVEQDLCPV